jgi:hypothetical protein
MPYIDINYINIIYLFASLLPQIEKTNKLIIEVDYPYQLGLVYMIIIIKSIHAPNLIIFAS